MSWLDGLRDRFHWLLRSGGAARALGSLGRTKEAVRDERGVSWIEDLGRDLAYAARGLRRRPGFTFAVLATIALGLTRFLRGFLFEVGATDPETFAGVAALLAAVASTAIAGPAVRATRVDPVKVLREE